MSREYSYTQLDTFHTCPLKYRYRYIDRIAPEVENIEPFMGSRVHEVLEWVYRAVMGGGRPPSLDEAVADLRSRWERAFSPRVRVVKRVPVESYLRSGIEGLTHYYNTFYPFNQSTTLAVEQPFSIEVDGARLRGRIDRLARAGEGIYEVHDYKTSLSPPDLDRLDDELQMSLYQMAVERNYPDAHEVRLIYHYICRGVTYPTSRTPGQLAATARRVAGDIAAIESTTDWKPSPGPLCRYCEYNDRCPAFVR